MVDKDPLGPRTTDSVSIFASLQAQFFAVGLACGRSAGLTMEVHSVPGRAECNWLIRILYSSIC
ncbi:hypothetical protein EJ03DRAFT_86277 [Teratosphaeria nubilosa]|uniref:Uncharacterized protein n=1 Tax=Teratosphaeria nubilosa TaxID=161662 RepID=A0A6G1LBF3_9PEZI|nr:hypothetical protein EJ03DRAFT_86277 [Teratosphaeria nubilosa]